MLLGVDVGGTFSDAVLVLDDGRLVTAKAPTTPEDQSIGVQAAVQAALDAAGARADGVGEFAHGMTVATNALLQGDGARTAFVATDGFTDLIALGRQARPELYRLCAAGPAPLAPAPLRFGVAERMTPDGPLLALSDEAVAELIEALRAAEPEAVAVTLLHAYRHPEHERRIGEALAAALPEVHVSLSHEVVGTFREYERAATTEVDAALSPLLAGYLRRLRDRCGELGLPAPTIMQSNGGLIELAAAAGHASWTVLSGPAGGAAGAAYVARAAGARDALCFDMGGTSCDVCVVDDGAVQERSAQTIAGRPLALAAVAVHTVGAGGGSIAWRDAGGALRVGPRSAGADPGPAGYGRGGIEPTVTDANLVLGYLAPDAPLAGGVQLDLGAAQRAVGALGDALGLSGAQCAEGIVRVANAEMLRALRVVTVERGIDPRRYALLCFGGAGGLHAAAIAAELGIAEIVCPRASGVLAALGLIVSPRRRDVQRSVFLSGARLTADAIAAVADELAAQARAQLEGSDTDNHAGGGPDNSTAVTDADTGDDDTDTDSHSDTDTDSDTDTNNDTDTDSHTDTADGTDTDSHSDTDSARAGPDTDEVALTATFELRYRGQAFELPIAAELHAEPARLRERFEQRHEERYGYRDPRQELELVTLRVSATTPGTDVQLGANAGAHDEPRADAGVHEQRRGPDPGEHDEPRNHAGAHEPRDNVGAPRDGDTTERPTRTARLDGGEVRLRIFQGAPAAGTTIAGPAVVELPESTLLVPPRWAGQVDVTGTVHLHSDGKAADGPG